MYSNNRMVLQLLALMKAYGIRRVVISPGSRHYPLIRSMEADDYFITYSVVDERSAAFFALGLIQRTSEPVAVSCTSGTSAINYGSAVVEAFYQGLPLVVLSADRLPELLNQKEEQMFRQHDVYAGFIRYEGQLRADADYLTDWYNNRTINEAFMELDHHGRGPVHLNFPIESHHTDTFSVTELPQVRKISRVHGDADDEVWTDLARQMEGRKVLILWGQAEPMSDRLQKSLDLFMERFDCAILGDKLSNCHHKRAIETSFQALHSMTSKQAMELLPDVVISVFGNYTFNGEIKSFLEHGHDAMQCWDVGRREVIDPFRRLSKVFAMSEAFFFRRLAEASAASASVSYFEGWSQVDAVVQEPNVGFGEIYAVGRLMKSLPKDSALQIANSLPIRMTHLFRSEPTVKVFCNRGVNGIDGCMSTAVGYAAATDGPVFHVIGDLTFFYDMNALWNRHLSKNLRILLLNNEGGGVMHLPLKDSLAADLSRHVSAGHVTTAKGWAESVGMRYFAVADAKSCDEAIAILTNPAEPGPILVEAFSKKEVDIKEYKAFMSNMSKMTFAEKAKRKLTRKLKREMPGLARKLRLTAFKR